MKSPLFSLRLFGGAVLEADEGAIAARAVQRRRLALLALVATAPNRRLSRDKLVAFLWPAGDTEQARHLLSDSLYILHKALGKDALTVVGDEVGLDTGFVWVDVVEFRLALAAADFERAVSLYRGPFLDGIFLSDAPEFERWVETQRDELARAYGTALERLATAAGQTGEIAAAANWWRRRAAHDPYDSRIALALMKSLAAAGDCAGALQHARLHAALLREELGLEPDASVRAFAEQLRAESAGRALTSVTPVAAEAPSESEASAESTAGPKLRSRRVRISARLAVAAALLLVCATTLLVVRRHAASAAPRLRPVVLASVSGPDSTLSLAVREALRAELESAPAVRVISDDAVRGTLRLMALPPNTQLTLQVAVELAQRRGAPLVIAGSATRVGTGVQIIAQLVDAANGSLIATVTERPANDGEVLRAVTRIAQSIRARVLESPLDTLPTLPAVSTASLDALRYYVRAREAAAKRDAAGAAELAEAALVHDSLFALAHYLAADQLWYIDQQRHSNRHMTRAYELSAKLPPRERLIVRARYEQLVRDRPDSALVYWKLLARIYPDEVLAYEGMRWVHRALGEMEPMVLASESAAQRDGRLRDRALHERIQVLVGRGDSVAAFELAKAVDKVEFARVNWAVKREDWSTALALLPATSHYSRHFVLLAMGRIADARQELEGVRRNPRVQEPPRAMLLQARMEIAYPESRTSALLLGREALAWLEAADLSAPAYARLAERIVDIAARAGDVMSIRRLRRFIQAQDSTQQLRSYGFALTTIDAAEAFARGDMNTAARLAARARPGMFYGRSIYTVVLLEADARAAIGDHARANALYRAIIDGTFTDGDGETAAILRRFARAALVPKPKSPTPTSTASRRSRESTR